MSSDICICCICNSKFEDGDIKTTVGPRGMENFISCSLERGDGKHVIWKNENKLIIHEECRVSYISKERVAVTKKRKLSTEPTINELSTDFDYKNCCVICALPCSEKLENKKPKKHRRKIHIIMENSTFKNRILEQCKKCTNESVNAVVKRLNDVDNLFSVGATYHNNCDVNFLSKLVSVKSSVNIRNTQYDKQFEKLFTFLENSEEPQWTLDEIINVLGEPAPNRKYVKNVLSERYEDKIIFSSNGRNRTIVTLKGFAEDLILDYFRNNISAENEKEKKSNILKLAARYIREDIRGMGMETEYYPPSNGFFGNDNINDVVPESLTSFLSDIILPQKKNVESYKKKITAISHSIIAAVRPISFISSLQLALSIYIHSKYQSKLLINMLNRLGMCASYDETLGLSKLEIKDVRALRSLRTEKTILLPGELLWVTGHSLRIPEHPGWNGFMELRTNSTLYSVSKINEQHKDLRESTVLRDLYDLRIMRKWFEEHCPFITSNQIVSLSTGVTGGSDVNCYNAEYFGLQSYKKLIPTFSTGPDGNVAVIEQFFGSVKFSQESQIIPLSVSNGSIIIGQSKFPIDEKILFTRFEKSDPDPKYYPKYFEYELCPYPLSIFDTPNSIRASKDDFFTLFTKTDKPNIGTFAIVDGETLLTQVSWTTNSTYMSVYEQYVNYLKNNYGNQCMIVFDSMTDDFNSIKVSAKLITTSATSVATEVYFDETKFTTKKRDILFQNHKNKCRFIVQLADVLRSYGILVKLTQPHEDFNHVIANEAMIQWRENRPPVIVSHNVDILCLLVAFVHKPQNMFFNIPGKAWYDTEKNQQQFQMLSPYLHVIRALTGTDVTSCFFNVSKKIVMKHLLKNQEEVRELLRVFDSPHSANNIPHLIERGEQLIMRFYNVQGKNLNDVRCQKYSSNLKNRRKTSFNLASLPPTSAAASHHIYRAYWLVQRWQNNIMPSLLWGWIIAHQTLVVPIATTLTPVPEELLNLIVCSCKKGCKSKTCSCRKSGLMCSDLCKECNDSCVNKPQILQDWQLTGYDDTYDEISLPKSFAFFLNRSSKHWTCAPTDYIGSSELYMEFNLKISTKDNRTVFLHPSGFPI
ncbi:Protein of unknown function [Cotesia congregata]|uniref:Uncharacterized protein n=1 Tax=Cotesia congregata TaxID=51543 RepID=A0A8J2MNN3_COTCN|nr:Protein of unknown function [Cotesia congregata]